MELIPSTKDRPATLELSDSDREQIAKMDSADFLRDDTFPTGISVMAWKSTEDDEAGE